VAFVLPEPDCSAAVVDDGCAAPLPNLNPPAPNVNPDAGFVLKPPGNETPPSVEVVVDDAADDDVEKLKTGDG